jgi:hypothetical protein
MHRAFGFRFVIFANDHSPLHIHVLGPEGEAKILLKEPSGVQVDWVIGIGRADMRRILRETEREHARLIAKWREIHG